VKKTALIINLIYGAALIALFILFFVAGSKKAESGDGGKIIKEKDEIDSVLLHAQGQSVKIAFVNTDSILSNYEYYKKSIEKFETQKKQAEKQFQDKYKKLEEDYKNYMTKINLGLMTEQEAEAQFSKKQQEVETYYNSLTEELLKKEERVSSQLYDSIISQVAQYNKTAGFTFIIAHSKGSNILYADPKLDLTDEIIKELNNSYYKWIGEDKGKKKKSKKN